MQTATNPVAEDEIKIDVFITEGADGQIGFNVTLSWDSAELTFKEYATARAFGGSISLTTPTNITAADSTAQLSAAFLGSSASTDAGSGGKATFTVNDDFSTVTTVNLGAGKLGSADVTISPDAAFVVIRGVVAAELATPAETANFDGDPTVGFGDFLIFAGGFGKASSDGDFGTRLDLEGDGTIDFGDFLMFAAVFGQTI